jgi:hypothetical protein
MVLDTTRTIKTPIQGKYKAKKLFQQNKRRKPCPNILRPIIKNRLNADFRQVNYYSAYIRRNAENAGNGQKTS